MSTEIGPPRFINGIIPLVTERVKTKIAIPKDRTRKIFSRKIIEITPAVESSFILRHDGEEERRLLVGEALSRTDLPFDSVYDGNQSNSGEVDEKITELRVTVFDNYLEIHIKRAEGADGGFSSVTSEWRIPKPEVEEKKGQGKFATGAFERGGRVRGGSLRFSKDNTELTGSGWLIKNSPLT